MNTIEMRAMAGKVNARDVARREVARESEAGDLSTREEIRGLKASHCAGQRRGE